MFKVKLEKKKNAELKASLWYQFPRPPNNYFKQNFMAQPLGFYSLYFCSVCHELFIIIKSSTQLSLEVGFYCTLQCRTKVVAHKVNGAKQYITYLSHTVISNSFRLHFLKYSLCFTGQNAKCSKM